MDKDKVILELAKLKNSSTFLTLKGYTNSVGEKADYNIVFHVSYESLLKRSILKLESMIPSNDLEITAKSELISSFNGSLKKLSSSEFEKLEENYYHIKKEDGTYLRGVKVHLDTGNIHLYGLLVSKNITTKAVYKEINSKPLTIAKNNLMKELPINNWRQFRVVPSQVEAIVVNKNKITI